MKEQQDNIDTDGQSTIEGDGDNTAQAAAAEPNAESATENTLTPEDIAKLKAEAAKAQENWDRYLRLNADFDNFKKRAAKDRLDAIRYANEDIIEKLLPVMDNFEAAMAAGTNTESGSVDALLTGVKMILGQLKNVLTDAGLEEIDAVGKPFDPTIHEALSQQASETVPEGHVLSQMRKGYKLRDRLIRPASVVVSGPAAAEADAG